MPDPNTMSNEAMCDEMAGYLGNRHIELPANAGPENYECWLYKDGSRGFAHPFPFNLTTIADPKSLPEGCFWDSIGATDSGFQATIAHKVLGWIERDHGDIEPRARLITEVLAWRRSKGIE